MAVLLVVATGVPCAQVLAAPDAASGGLRSSDLARRPEVASALQQLEAWIESEMEFRAIPGMSVGIVYDQELIWARGFGYADLEKKIPATPATLYRIASISKLFTSTAILQLRDAGRLQLDDAVEKHLPWFKIKARVPSSVPITIQNLLTHTGGVPREAPYPYWHDFNFPTLEQIIEGLARMLIYYSIQSCFMDAVLSEHLARMIAMRNATDNAEDMIKQLTTDYNRARQSQITSELLDIVSGMGALE